MDKKKIGIQGGIASFHDTVAHIYFGEEIEVVECATFERLCEVVKQGEVDYAVMAIENSIAGSIIPNYSLIESYELGIIGEVKLRIMMHFMALPGQEIQDITKVMSHYMALLQCNEFLNQYPAIESKKTHDTADSAKMIREGELKGVAAIAGYRAAKTYDLTVLASEIETIKENFTRFFILSKEEKVASSEINKTTLSFQLPNQVGSLATVLKSIVDHEINLTKIQSVPIIGKPDEYTFYVDCEYSSYKRYRECMAVLRQHVNNPRILGEYKKGEFVFDDYQGV
ncbi:MAG: prephenate dehydratase [Cyclobacteriaceae bacterium]